MKPDYKWQRARIGLCAIGELQGAEIWVEIGPPELREGHNTSDLKPTGKRDSYFTHLLINNPNFKEQRVDIDKRMIELLARDEKDFTGEVERADYWEFIKSRKQGISITTEGAKHGPTTN